MNQKEQLASLAGSRSAAGRGRKRNWGSLLLLLLFLGGVALVFVLVFGNRLRPRIPVTVVPALLLESEASGGAQTPPRPREVLAQASGWIEPDPYPIRVPVKVDGFVESVAVYAGDAVEKGQQLAALDPTNFALRADRLSASLAEARALETVRTREVAQARADRTAAAAAHDAAAAALREAEDRLARIRTLEPGDVAEADVVSAEQAVTSARAARDAARARLTRAGAAVETREAEQARQAAQVEGLGVDLARARLDLARTTVRAPMAGRVLERVAAPGMKRRAATEDPDSATVVTLYDPERLQVRVDVPLSDAGRLVTGMPARAVTAALPGQTFTGHISRITGKADITRNTLQVKVALARPDPRLRPEMLCRVEFLSVPAARAGGSSRARQVWLSGAALPDAAGDAATVWVVDPVTETVSPRDITVGAPSRDGRRLIREGLLPGERVVVDSDRSLTPGASVSIQEERQP